MIEKKLVSYCLFTYNQETFIETALKGALSQTYFPLEIIISDDCSTDKTYEIIKDTTKNYSGTHKIILNRNEKNLGIGSHVSKLIYNLAHGEILILIAGDDISKHDHVEKAVAHFDKFSDVNLIDFSSERIDSTGIPIGKQASFPFQSNKMTIEDYVMLRRMYTHAPGRLITKKLIESFDDINSNCPTEDSVLVLRGLLCGGIRKVNDSLLFYRQHCNNMSNYDNLSRLDSNAIVDQYKKDLLKAKDNQFITDNQYKVLIHRVNYEYRTRKLVWNGKHRNYRLFLGIRRAIYSFIFSIKWKHNSQIRNGKDSQLSYNARGNV